jgi:hypothetical protein
MAFLNALHSGYLGARFGHETHKPAGQLMDSLLLTQADGFLGHQLSTNANGRRSGENEICGCHLIYATGCN